MTTDVRRYSLSAMFGLTDTPDGDQIRDFAKYKLEGFRNYMKGRSVQRIMITSAYENAADLISMEYYGTEDYWHVLCLFNQVTDPFAGIPAGMYFYIPSLTDIESFRQQLEVKSSRGVNVVLS